MFFHWLRSRFSALGLSAWCVTMAAGGAGAEPTRMAGLNEAGVAGFAASYLEERMREAKIPGAALAVVKDGRVVFADGFGLADVASRRAVSVDETVFRVASISKVFTAAAALRLAGKGRLDLHADVNAYLRAIEIDPSFDTPVTLHHLLTHSAGFDYQWLHHGARNLDERLELLDYLTAHQPVRLRPPGLFSSYDNYGFALAGHLVQRVSGEPFARFIRTRWLEPLGMTNSTFALSEEGAAGLARGYRLEDDRLRPLPVDYVNIPPAAGLATTAGDMSRFLIALTANRLPDGTPAFAPEAYAGLLEPQFAFHPAIPGRSYGFNEVFLNGRRVLKQLGSWPGFNSVLVIFPQSRVGLFFAYNRNDGLELARSLVQTFTGQFPKSASPVMETFEPPARQFDEDMAPWTGTYVASRFPWRAPFLGVAPEQTVRVNPDGALEIGDATYRQIEPGVFERTGSPGAGPAGVGRRIAFLPSEEGPASHLVTERGVYRRVAWYETGSAWRVVAFGVCLILLSALSWWPVAGAIMLLKRLFVANSGELPGRERRRLGMGWLARGTGMLAGGMGLWLLVQPTLIRLGQDSFPYLYGLPEPVLVLTRVAPIFLGLTLLVAGCCVVAWRRGFWSLASRLHYSLLVLAAALLCLDLYRRNLLFP
jgi:CubicO group peptidase (beta-lactamase class C family)